MPIIEISSQYKYTGKGPVDAKALVKTYADLLDTSTWQTSDGGMSAYNTKIVGVWLNKEDTSKNGIYYLFDPACTSTIKNPDVTNEANWHKLAELSELDALAERVQALENAGTATGITEEQLNAAIEVLRQEIAGMGYLTSEDLVDYALKSELPSTEGLATETYVQEQIAKIEIPVVPTDISAFNNDAGYLTEHQDISGKADVEHLHSINDITDYQAPDLEPYALKSEIPSVEGLASETYVDEKINSIKIPDTSNFITIEDIEAKGYITEVPAEYITETELEEKGYITEHQSLEGYATKTFVQDEIAKIPETDLSEYAKKAEIPSLEGLATTEYVDTKIAEIPETDLTGYATEDFVTSEIAKAQLEGEEINLDAYALKTDIPSVEGFIKIEDVEAKGYITDVPAEYITEEELNAKGYLTEHQSLEAYATKEELATKVDNATYEADKATFLTSIPEEFVTEGELDTRINTVEEKVTTAETNANLYTDNTKAELQGYIDSKAEASNVYSRSEADETFAVKGEDAYDDTDVKNRLSTLEETVNEDLETRLSRVEDFFETAEGETLDEALDTLVEIQRYIDADGEVAEQVLLNKTAIETLKGTGEGSVNKKISDAVAPLATIEALNEVKTTTEAELAKKLETATLTHARAADEENGIEALPEGITLNGTELAIVIDAPTRAETIQLIADKVADVTGGESAADVKLSLEAEVERSTAKDTAHDTAIAAAKAQADTNKEDIASLNRSVETLINKDTEIAAILDTKANASDVYTKTEANTTFMTEDEVVAKISAIDFTPYAKLNDVNAALELKANAADVADQIAAIVTPKASKEITVAENGTLGLGEVSTDKFVQGTETLVLLGGSATA